ncbi:MAG TPA: radical SAM protein [Candidatus Deferrimicrobium sp.]|nr:radical SAM protein [Candidatus Deferrimicrobium sp.]
MPRNSKGPWCRSGRYYFKGGIPVKYCYGPVPSRRLGRSLGVDPIPAKTCNFSCIYCQLGRTITLINDRRDFYSREEIFHEIQERINSIGIDHIDYVTFVGDGEPTLCKSLGWLLEHVKAEFSLPAAVITNGALLSLNELRDELSIADVILPTLDAGFPETFKQINRPHPSIQFYAMIEGMIEFRRRYSGQIWVEYMVVQRLNDTQREIQQIQKYLKEINPNRVYINVPIRPPAEEWVILPDQKTVERIREKLIDAVGINRPEQGEFQILFNESSMLKNEILQIIKRHPMRLAQAEELLRTKKVVNPAEILADLEKTGQIKRVEYENTTFLFSADVKRGK